MQRSLASIKPKQSSTQRELIGCWLRGPLAIWATPGTDPPSPPLHILSTGAGCMRSCCTFYISRVGSFSPPLPASLWLGVCLVACGSSRRLAGCTASGWKEAGRAETAWQWPQTWAAACWCHAASCHCVFFGWNKPGGNCNQSGELFSYCSATIAESSKGKCRTLSERWSVCNSLHTQWEPSFMYHFYTCVSI